MGIWSALFWGAFSSAALFIGQALARPMTNATRLTGMVMGFGAGTLLSAVAYELIPEANIERGPGVVVAFLAGAVVYFVADRVIDMRGGANRQQIDTDHSGGSGMAMFLGALLDGIPEAFILGISLAQGNGISVAFVTAVFVSNIPQGIAGTTSLRTAGVNERRILRMWTALTVACAVVAVGGFALAEHTGVTGLYSEAFAAGAVLTMLANSMMPEAFEEGGVLVGLCTVVGYLVAAVLSTLG